EATPAAGGGVTRSPTSVTSSSCPAQAAARGRSLPALVQPDPVSVHEHDGAPAARVSPALHVAIGASGDGLHAAEVEVRAAPARDRHAALLQPPQRHLVDPGLRLPHAVLEVDPGSANCVV